MAVTIAAQNSDIIIFKNADFDLTVTLDLDGLPIDLTGWTIKSEIRVSPSGRLLGSFACTVTKPHSGEFRLFMAKSACEALSFVSPAYYDIVRTNGLGETKRIIPVSRVYLEDGVTR